MKKLFVLLIALILFTLAFTSCGTPKSAEDLMDKIDKKMDSLKSYQADLTANLSTTISGLQCKADFTGNNIMINGNEGKFYYYNMMEGTMEIKDGEKNEVMETVKSKDIEAFHEDKMFVLHEQGEQKQALYSPLTKDEYIAYREKQENSLDIDYEACVNSTFVQNEDKTWTMTYSGYTKKVIDKVVEYFGGDEIFEEEVEDMEITIHANADYTVKSMELKMVFENESTTSEFRMKMEYSKYETATPIVDTLDVSKYQEISDCRLLTEIQDLLEDLEELENGSFVLDIKQTISTSSPSYTQTNTERDTVTYGKKDGKYFYDIKALSNNTKYNISYANGKQTVEVSGESQSADQTEKEAKAFINGLINTPKYQAILVSSIKKTDDGVYTIRCNKPDASLYRPVFSSLSASAQNVSQTIKITVQDGKITKIESTLSARSNYTVYYGTISFDLSSECEFYY